MIFKKDELLFLISATFWVGREGGALPMMAYTGRLPKKGLRFLGFRYIKSRDSIIWVCKRAQKRYGL